jgi:(p)ppGpp synthase/HD superfamily hydrolase
MFAAIGNSETTVTKVINKLKKPVVIETTNFVTQKQIKTGKNDIIGLEVMLYNMAKCCTPLPGEPIVGVVTRSKGVSVHIIDCNCLDGAPAERLMKVEWADTTTSKTYLAFIKIDVADKVGMLKEVMTKVTDCNTNINYANVKANAAKKLGVVELGIEVDSIEKLKTVMNALQALPDVHSVKRINSNTKQCQVSFQKNTSKKKKK